MTDTQERLERLEKSNRRMRFCGIGVAAVAAAVTTIAATSGDSGDRGSPPCECSLVACNYLLNSGPSQLHGPVYCASYVEVNGHMQVYSDLEVWGDAQFIGDNGAPFLVSVLESEVDGHANDILVNESRINMNEDLILDLQEMVSACCDGSACSSDSNSDGYVNVADLLAVIDQWGVCEEG